jgi:hypothetical protein
LVALSSTLQFPSLNVETVPLATPNFSRSLHVATPSLGMLNFGEECDMKRGREGACESRCFLIDTPARYFICFNEATAFIPPTSPLPHMLPIPILVGENGLGGKTVALDFHSHLPVHAMLPSTVAKKFGRCNFTRRCFLSALSQNSRRVSSDGTRVLCRDKVNTRQANC